MKAMQPKQPTEKYSRKLDLQIVANIAKKYWSACNKKEDPQCVIYALAAGAALRLACDPSRKLFLALLGKVFK